MPYSRVARWERRATPYNRYSLTPKLDLRPLTAWALCYEAAHQRKTVSALMSELLDAWTDPYLSGLSPAHRELFVASIPVVKRASLTPQG